MGHRSDVVALVARRAALAADIARLELQVETLTKLAAELDVLRRERDAIDARLRKQYRARWWAKKKGIALLRLPSGALRRAEVHWYEAHVSAASR